MKLKIFGLVLISFMLLGSVSAIPYKWASTTPIAYVDISNIQDIETLDYYLNSDSFVVIYAGKNFKMDKKNKEFINYIGLVELNSISSKIPDFSSMPFLTQGSTIYPKNYVYRDKNGVYIFVSSDVEAKNEVGIFTSNIPSKIYNDGFYEIKPKKLFIPYDIDLENKEILDFIGNYVSKHGETFAYINKVPSGYDNIVISAVAVQNLIPEKSGSYAVSVSGRKINVELRNEQTLNEKIRRIKTVSELLGIQTTYITTGSENIHVIMDTKISDAEKEELLNDYWFKKRYGEFYTHIKYSEKENLYKNNYDVLAMSYYPIMYINKAPNTLNNDPYGGYYPKTVSYSGTESTGYWNEGPKSENYYYRYDGEEYWNEKETVSRNYWSVNGEFASLSQEAEFNNRYEYFSNWYVKNYAYAMAEGTDGILLFSSDKTLLDLVFSRENKDISWSLNLKGVDYVVVPDHMGYDKINGVSVIKVPGLNNNDINGVHFINEIYIKPENENYGVYVADIIEFDTNKLYTLNDENIWVCSFKEYAKWAEEYRTSSILIKNDTIYVKADDYAKITVFKNNIVPVKNTITESYNSSGKLVIANAPEIIQLNS
ncbi:conserved hypothetical protein [Methanococcus vannielii SB]|jgi:hypothetical protein|uniref:Uncharacterized protein n=1 Tax=Methanococcus vannielii (strain ATCC 35089 / DSM 1224 / JCM 13029 / OCM 148 / SB) TaxID=406327 RepID=A6UR03_METVS|nr:hypothetical protein [Methanococcus vannielii]ABR54925.1 conserved hypothetical protein [Methanococcus vannielii SB]